MAGCPVMPDKDSEVCQGEEHRDLQLCMADPSEVLARVGVARNADPGVEVGYRRVEGSACIASERGVCPFRIGVVAW